MTAATNDDMPAEIDFTGGARGKFYRANVKLNVPVYLDADVQAYLAAIASRKGGDGFDHERAFSPDRGMRKQLALRSESRDKLEGSCRPPLQPA